MNTQLINKLAKEATKSEDTYPAGCNGHPIPVTYFDRDLFAKLLIEETIKLLNKGDPDFNRFSENLVRQHFGVR